MSHKTSNGTACLPAEIARRESTFDARRADWRFGNVVYQIFVDRFSPTTRLDSKREHYAAPRTLHPWSEDPSRGKFLDNERNHEAELQFWGGDLESVASRIGYLEELGVELVYLNPIFEAFTNHKYDASDFFKIDPQFGTKEELKSLVDALHARGMRLMLDGVFNHMGRRSELFQRALANPTGPERELFVFGEDHKHGYLGWRNVANLPEVNLENAAARAMTIEGPQSAVVHYIRDIGIDGWRLDVAPDVGFTWLSTITRESHATRSDTAVIGECWNYPEDWLACVDGIMNMHVRAIILSMLDGKMTARHAARSMDRMAHDAPLDGLLRSHMVLDNHDLPRITTVLPNRPEQIIARVLQFTLPGCPVIYYGSELAMQGGADPTNRGPMRWELATDENEELALVRKLVAMRRENPALRIGEFRVLESDKLFAFLRRTDRARETVLVIANPSAEDVTELIPVRDSRWMDAAPVTCLLTGAKAALTCGLVEARVPARTVQVFRTEDRGNAPGYSMFKRVP